MTLDTNILIAYLNGEESVMSALATWRKEGRALYVSSVSTAEVLALPTLTPPEYARVQHFLADFISVPFDNRLAEIVALLRRTYHLKIPDAAIAATALMHEVPLATRDKQFHAIKELTVVAL